jgi:hypothetical protein
MRRIPTTRRRGTPTSRPSTGRPRSRSTWGRGSRSPHFLGRRLAYVYEVKEIVAGERFVMSTADGPFPMETTYTWRDAENGATRMTLRNRGEPSGFPRLIAPLMASAVRRANRKDLARLKRILKAGGPTGVVG